MSCYAQGWLQFSPRTTNTYAHTQWDMKAWWENEYGFIMISVCSNVTGCHQLNFIKFALVIPKAGICCGHQRVQRGALQVASSCKQSSFEELRNLELETRLAGNNPVLGGAVEHNRATPEAVVCSMPYRHYYCICRYLWCHPQKHKNTPSTSGPWVWVGCNGTWNPIIMDAEAKRFTAKKAPWTLKALEWLTGEDSWQHCCYVMNV
jgi:hypothetical protein